MEVLIGIVTIGAVWFGCMLIMRAGSNAARNIIRSNKYKDHQ